MIGYLKGKNLTNIGSQLILEVQGIGYRVFVGPDLLLSPTGAELELFIYHKSSDDGQALFGFANIETLKFFELLITVPGVGPKTALGIVSTSTLEVLSDAIHSEDAAFFGKMSGVGKKTAEKIIVELKNKIGLNSQDNVLGPRGNDVFEALTSLGYSAGEIRNTLKTISRELTTDEQLKEALKLLSK